jgi:hypothetical protein
MIGGHSFKLNRVLATIEIADRKPKNDRDGDRGI